MNRSVALCLLLMPGLAAAQKASYHDTAALHTAIDAFDGVAGGRMTVHRIGRTPGGHQIRAVHLAEVGGAGDQAADDADKPALLIECGMHAREWAGPEMCLMWLQGVALGFLLQPARMDDILAHADIWVIPLVNPDGRDLDDTGGGDPENYWTSTAIHPHGSDGSGWRTNAQTVACGGAPNGENLGIDLARAFSRGWSTAGAREFDCLDNKYHGAYPFEAREARVLRRFVNNRMISMSLSVHSFRPCVGAQNGPGGIPSTFRDIWNAEAAAPELQLSYAAGDCEGTGHGQFTAWMAQSSDTPFETDHSTRRGAVALLLELPPDGAAYDRKLFPSPYRYDPYDLSNAFHPSADLFIGDTYDAFWDAVTWLAEQARSPWCPVDPTTLAPDPKCARDIGLTGSKIANCADCVGALRMLDLGTHAIERVRDGLRHVVYRVQNFDAASTENAQVTVVISSRVAGSGSPYSTDLIDAQSFTLAAQGGDHGTVPFNFVAGREYMVSITAIPTSFPLSDDTEGDNDKHLFRFEAY